MRKPIKILLATFIFSIPLVGNSNQICTWENSSTWGQNLSCQNPNLAFGVCGSGKNKDCANGTVANQIYCCNEPITFSPKNPVTVTTTDYGKRISCPPNQVVTDFCGSGKNKDCSNNVVNSITCITVDSISLQEKTNTWYGTSEYGKQVFCPNSMIMTGVCGSGQKKDCLDGMVNEIQCTTYEIP